MKRRLVWVPGDGWVLYAVWRRGTIDEQARRWVEVFQPCSCTCHQPDAGVEMHFMPCCDGPGGPGGAGQVLRRGVMTEFRLPR